MRSWSLLLITDLHYENPNSNFIDDNDEKKDPVQPGFREQLFPSYDNILKWGFSDKKLDLIVVGGDITTHGNKEGFDRFRASLGLMQKLVKDPQDICIIPGNHDVQWGLDPVDTGSFDIKFQPFLKMVEEAEATSCLYPGGELTPETDSKLTLREPPNGHGPIYLNDRAKLLVLCINSAIRCGERNGKMAAEIASPVREALKELQQAGLSGAASKAAELLSQAEQCLPKYLIRDVAHVTQRQRDNLTDRLRGYKKSLDTEWGSYLRVAILHHHLVRFPKQTTEHRGYELLVDSGDVLSMLAEFDFDLVLTGHKHQAYIMHSPPLNKKHLLIVGGPTVGGHSAGGSFRGLRWIQVKEESASRSCTTIDIPWDAGQGDVQAKISDCEAKAQKEELRVAETEWERDFKKKGFSYRELASITVLNEDGDARRTVECDDLRIKKSGIDRSRFHKLGLPLTSGYLAQLGVGSKDFDLTIKIEDSIDRKSRKKSWEGAFRFKPDIGADKPVSYSYRWYAVNAFAMDKRQFGYMYPDQTELPNIEFTHFLVEDPIEDFTLAVSFPEGFNMKFPLPKVRVAVIDAKQPDSRQWKIEKDEEDRLEDKHLLHYYASMNIAALRVNRPRIGLSYGIQWPVPAELRGVGEARSQETTIEAWRQRWGRGITSQERKALLGQLARICEFALSTVLDEWRGPIDAGLLYFDGEAQLPVLAALGVSWKGTKPQRDEVFKGLSLRYGDGIGGRAFKTNRVRVYVHTVSGSDQDSAEPDYYTYLGTGPHHNVLVSLPVHLPEQDESFKKNNHIYETKIPYGVFSIGSEEPDCPLAALRLPERAPDALRFQHDVNVQLFSCFKTLFSAETTAPLRRKST